MNVPLQPAQKQALLDYIALLQRWNRTYNLTAVRDPRQMLVQHIFDSLSVVQPLQAELRRHGREESAARVADIGSGAGLPGVVLAVMFPGWQVHCVDAVEKKMAFVRQAAGVLGLANLHAAHARVEALPVLNADVVVSRAFASLFDFAILAGRHVAADGCMLAMKGREPLDEIQALQETEWEVARVEPVSVPELNARRCLVWMNRRQGNL
ncbi:16S rRNA (guanine(527)-N(7))-methyltransferase RsmG [Candidimonas nitroreducens]|nr:16S rRNA (guanine(527)-N(7))-methyltransferase RsmG [Candidimonas nitroreducens]